MIQRNAKRLMQLTNNLMDFRKLEEGNSKLKVQYGDLLATIKEAKSCFDLEMKTRQVDLRIETNQTHIYAWFDHDKLTTILLNLLSNAFKHTPEKGKIRISASSFNHTNKEGYTDKAEDGYEYIKIKVINTGIGIPAEELSHIFDRFYQLKANQKRKLPGTGVGLSLSKNYVELHHGRIWAESTTHQETSFTFIIPIDRNAYNENEISAESESILNDNYIIHNEPPKNRNNEKHPKETNEKEELSEILIVEDNAELRALLTKELGDRYKVTGAEDGMTGIELAQKNIPDLIVSDVLMPNTNGMELCNTLKSDIRTSHIPIILLTAKTTLQEQIEGIQNGADAYITKPFHIQFLMVKINQLIQSRKNLYAHFSQDVYMIPNQSANNNIDQNFLRQAIDYIIENIAENNISAESLADHLNLSRSNVYRKIKALTGKNIIEFIRDIRLKQAIKLMETGQYTLAEIAYKTGFSSPSYFTKSFKDQFGKPPSEYVKR